MKTATDLSSLLPPSRYDNAPPAKRRHTRLIESDAADLKLRQLDFLNCLINKVSVRKYIMKNNSGIRAAFNIHSQNFEPNRYLSDMVPPMTVQHTGEGETPKSGKSKMEMTERSKLQVPQCE